jgi:hypothetical protein
MLAINLRVLLFWTRSEICLAVESISKQTNYYRKIVLTTWKKEILKPIQYLSCRNRNANNAGSLVSGAAEVSSVTQQQWVLPTEMQGTPWLGHEVSPRHRISLGL